MGGAQGQTQRQTQGQTHGYIRSSRRRPVPATEAAPKPKFSEDLLLLNISCYATLFLFALSAAST